MSPKKWATTTNAKGLFVKVGRGGGTFARKDNLFMIPYKEKMDRDTIYYFKEINFKRKMFGMDVDTIFKIRGERLGIA